MKCYKSALSGAVIAVLSISSWAAMAAPVTSQKAQKATPAGKPGEASAPDTVPSVKLGAFLMYDLTWHQGSGVLQNATTPSGEYADESGFRRVRVSASGKLHEDLNYNVSLEMADAVNQGDAVELYQALISYSGLKPVKLKVGQFFEPFSLEAMTSSRHTTFMERGLPYMFYPGRNLGAGVSAELADNLTLEGGLFANNVDSSGKSKESYTGRITYAPWHERGKVIHVGASASYRVPENNRVGYSQDPEAAFAPNYFSASVTSVDSVLLTGLEAAVVSGPFSLQGEYIQSDISRTNTSQERTFDGYYIYASWFVSGESRPYNNGRFTGIKPEHKFDIGKGVWGAWELALRSSQINADNGRTLSDVTLGVNWYLNRDIRFMANYVQADYEGDLTQGSADIFEVRGQVEF